MTVKRTDTVLTVAGAISAPADKMIRLDADFAEMSLNVLDLQGTGTPTIRARLVQQVNPRLSLPYDNADGTFLVGSRVKGDSSFAEGTIVADASNTLQLVNPTGRFLDNETFAEINTEGASDPHSHATVSVGQAAAAAVSSAQATAGFTLGIGTTRSFTVTLDSTLTGALGAAGNDWTFRLQDSSVANTASVSVDTNNLTVTLLVDAGSLYNHTTIETAFVGVTGVSAVNSGGSPNSNSFKLSDGTLLLNGNTISESFSGGVSAVAAKTENRITATLGTPVASGTEGNSWSIVFHAGDAVVVADHTTEILYVYVPSTWSSLEIGGDGELTDGGTNSILGTGIGGDGMVRFSTTISNWSGTPAQFIGQSADFAGGADGASAQVNSATGGTTVYDDGETVADTEAVAVDTKVAVDDSNVYDPKPPHKWHKLKIDEGGSWTDATFTVSLERAT